MIRESAIRTTANTNIRIVGLIRDYPNIRIFATALDTVLTSLSASGGVNPPQSM